MSPEIALLFRAVLLGLFVLAAEQLGKRYQEKQARKEQAVADHATVRQPAATPVAQTALEPEFRYVRVVTARAEHAPLEPHSVSARIFVPACIIEKRSIGAYVTEKRRLTASEEAYSPVTWLAATELDEAVSADAKAGSTGVDKACDRRVQNPHSYETA